MLPSTRPPAVESASASTEGVRGRFGEQSYSHRHVGFQSSSLALLFWKLDLLALIMYVPWRAHSEGPVRPPIVIQSDALNGGLPSRQAGFKFRVQIIFLFQNPIHPFGEGILSAVILLSHAHPQTGLCHCLDVGVRRILTPAVRVVDWLLAGREPS